MAYERYEWDELDDITPERLNHLESQAEEAARYTDEQIAAAGAASTYIHIQSSPSTNWEIIHPLNKFPSVTVVDSANSVVMGDVIFISLSQIAVIFSAPFSGRAYLN